MVAATDNLEKRLNTDTASQADDLGAKLKSEERSPILPEGKKEKEIEEAFETFYKTPRRRAFYTATKSLTSALGWYMGLPSGYAYAALGAAAGWFGRKLDFYAVHRLPKVWKEGRESIRKVLNEEKKGVLDYIKSYAKIAGAVGTGVADEAVYAVKHTLFKRDMIRNPVGTAAGAAVGMLYGPSILKGLNAVWGSIGIPWFHKYAEYYA